MFLSQLLLVFTLSFASWHPSSSSTVAALADTSRSPTRRPHKREDGLASFGDTINILGKMERTDQDFADGLALDILSPTNRTLVVYQNQSPLSGAFVSGSNGEPFLALSNYSYVVRMNETANDLIAKIELPYDPVALQKMGVTTANTYVGQLAAGKASWVVSESQRNVHETENKTRIIKMTSLEGEYILLGRKTDDKANIFVQYGQGATRTVNITGGAGVQEAEFIDGLRFSIRAEASMTMNVEIRSNDVVQGSIPRGFTAANSYVWAINTTDAQNFRNASLFVPFTPSRFAPNTMPALAYRPASNKIAAASSNSTNTVTSSPGEFTILHSSGSANTSIMDMQPLTSDTIRFAIIGLTQLDGEYLLLTSNGATPNNNRSSTGSAGSVGGIGNTSNGTSLKSAGNENRHVDALLTYAVTSIWVLLATFALAK